MSQQDQYTKPDASGRPRRARRGWLGFISAVAFVVGLTAAAALAGYTPYKTGSATGNVYYSSPSWWSWTDWSITDTSPGSVTVCHNSSAQGTACASNSVWGNPGFTATGSQRCKQISPSVRSIYCEALRVPS